MWGCQHTMQMCQAVCHLNFLESYLEQNNGNKKAFQSSANHPLADSLRFRVNKFEYVMGVRGAAGPCTVRSKMNKFKHVQRTWVL